MQVACSTLCFRHRSLSDALQAIRDMHFAKVDLAIHEAGPHLRPSEVMEDVVKIAQRLKATNVPIAAFHVEFDAAPNVVLDQLRAVCRLARLLAVPILTVTAAPMGSDPASEVQRLKDWAKIVQGDGLILTLETRAGTLTADIECAMELCHRVPGLGLTLDPSYYMCGPHEQSNYEPLFPYVRHVRLRDSGTEPSQFQVRVGQGVLEYNKLITSLERYSYDRALTVDVRDIADPEFPVEPEVRKMKYLLESLV